MKTVQSIPTVYRGILFRSALETKWAMMLDIIGIQFKYESRLFKTNDGYYLPDFWLPDLGCWLELKPSTDEGPSDDEYLKAQAVADQDKKPCFIVCGFPKSEKGCNQAILFLPGTKPVHFYVQNMLWNISERERLLYSAAAMSAETRLGDTSTRHIGDIALQVAIDVGVIDRYKHNSASQENIASVEPSRLLTDIKDLIVNSAREIFSSLECLKQAQLDRLTN